MCVGGGSTLQQDGVLSYIKKMGEIGRLMGGEKSVCYNVGASRCDPGSLYFVLFSLEVLSVLPLYSHMNFMPC